MGEFVGLNKNVSKLVYGCALDVMASGGDNSDILDACMEKGINFFDTARCYGDSEISLGKWINARNNREDVVVLSKGCHPLPDSLSVSRVTPEDIVKDLDDSLNRLSTDYIDIYLLHRDDVSVPVEKLMDTLANEWKKGKIKSYGVSNWTLDRFKEAQEYARLANIPGFAVNSPNYSLADQVNDPWESGSEAISIGGKDNEAVREYYKNNNIPIVAYSSLARGLFSGKFKSSQSDKAATAMDRFAIKGYYSKDNLKKLERVEKLAEQRGATVPQIALAYLLNQQLRVYPVVSFSNVNHLDSNIDALNIKLADDEIKYLEG